MSLEQAQLAKIDLSLSKCDLHAGLRLLDIGCGWGTTAIRAAETYNVEVIGLTLSANQHAYGRQRLESQPLSSGSVDFRLQGWEEFEEPVDRIVSIGAFEHFRKTAPSRILHAMSNHSCPWRANDAAHHRLQFFLTTTRAWNYHHRRGYCIRPFYSPEIFPGGEICNPERIEALATEAKFEVFHTQSLRLHYAQQFRLLGSQS